MRRAYTLRKKIFCRFVTCHRDAISFGKHSVMQNAFYGDVKSPGQPRFYATTQTLTEIKKERERKMIREKKGAERRETRKYRVNAYRPAKITDYGASLRIKSSIWQKHECTASPLASAPSVSRGFDPRNIAKGRSSPFTALLVFLPKFQTDILASPAIRRPELHFPRCESPCESLASPYPPSLLPLVPAASHLFIREPHLPR